MVGRHIFIFYLTSKPSNRKQALWASISFRHSGCSSPYWTIHSSRGFLVSGQQQHIGLPLLIPTFFGLTSYSVRITPKMFLVSFRSHRCVVVYVSNPNHPMCPAQKSQIVVVSWEFRRTRKKSTKSTHMRETHHPQQADNDSVKRCARTHAKSFEIKNNSNHCKDVLFLHPAGCSVLD